MMASVSFLLRHSPSLSLLPLFFSARQSEWIFHIRLSPNSPANAKVFHFCHSVVMRRRLSLWQCKWSGHSAYHNFWAECFDLKVETFDLKDKICYK
jgi:hypothetical protein